MGAAGLGARVVGSKYAIISNLSLFYILNKMFGRGNRN